MIVVKESSQLVGKTCRTQVLRSSAIYFVSTMSFTSEVMVHVRDIGSRPVPL